MYVALPFLYGNSPSYFSTGKIAALLLGTIMMSITSLRTFDVSFSRFKSIFYQ